MSDERIKTDQRLIMTDQSFFRFLSEIYYWCSFIKRTYRTEKGDISKNSLVSDIHFEATSIRQTPCSKNKGFYQMPCLNFMSGMAGVDSSIRDSSDLLDNTTNIE